MMISVTDFSKIKCPFLALSAVLALLLVFTAPVSAQPGNHREAHLIVVGPGDPLYTYWGHIGISISNKETGEDFFYDFGNFSFFSENFYRDFALGRMLYQGMQTPTDLFLNYSLTENRDLTVYPLNLGEAELDILEARLKWWMLPENRVYLYDYFHDNCATIIRDVLDEAIGGSLKNQSQGITNLSFRKLARIGAHSSAASEILLHFLLGPAQDYNISEWEWMFMPEAVAEIGSRVAYEGVDGVTRKLLGEAIVLKESTRPEVPADYRSLWPLLLIIGLVVSALWIYSSAAEPEQRLPAIVLTVLRFLIVLVVGLLGLLLGFLMVFTDHAAAYNNINIGPFFPTVLFALIPIAKAHRKTGSIRRKLENRIAFIWSINLAALLVVMLLRAAGVSNQDAFAFWALCLPLTAAASWPGRRWGERLVKTGRIRKAG